MKKIILLLLLFFSSAVSETYYTGLIFDDDAYDNAPRSATLLTRDIAFLPSSVSLEAYTPEVGSQGQTGTCNAWATAYGARTILESIAYHRMNRSQSTKNAFSPSYIYNQIRLEEGCNDGTYIHDALNLMKSEGVAKFSKFGFNCDKAVTDKDKQNASSYKIQDYKTLFARQSQNKVQLVKKALSEKKPVVIAMKIAKSFHKRGEHTWQPKGNEYQNISALGGHAMVVIGYDDHKDGGSFKLMNSWGKSWGDNGFKWVRYQDFQYFVPYAYELISAPLPTEQVSMGGALAFIDSNGQKMKATYDKHRGIYVMNQSYYSGTRFNFIMTNKEPIYLYAFGLDALAKSKTIFPHNHKVSPYQGYTNSSIAFPDEFHYIQMDNTKGKDYVVVLYSKNPLKLDKIQTLVENQKGTVRQRVNAVLRDKIISKNINFKKHNIDFDYKGHKNIGADSKDMVIAVIVEFDHK